MNDKNGMRIWDGDFVVGVDPHGKACDGTVIGKIYDPPVVMIMDDNGHVTTLNPLKVEILEMVDATD